jgi:hypothetical protein
LTARSPLCLAADGAHPDACWPVVVWFALHEDRPLFAFAGIWTVANMNGNRYYGVRVEGAKYGVGFGSAFAIAISYTANHSILWAIIHGVLGWLYVIYFALFRT